jgi:hypothetical protein
VCGKPLAEHGGTAPAIAPVEGLEPTLHEADPFVLPEALPALEPTAHAPAAELPGSVADVEPTCTAPVRVAATSIPDLETTAATGLPDDAPTALPTTVLCRYCRSPAMPGERICGNCGMRLPVTADRGAPHQAVPELPVCGCGMPVAGPLCPVCGARRSGSGAA